jgi:hypothetical protein
MKKTTAGVWIDHRKAVIVLSSAEGLQTLEVRSRVEKQLGRVEGLRSTVPYESQQVPADDTRDRRYQGLLRRYYDVVIAAIRPAETLLLFGPGEAKGELRKRLAHARLAGRVVAVDTVDKMTNRQVAAKVRDYGEGPPPAAGARPERHDHFRKPGLHQPHQPRGRT